MLELSVATDGNATTELADNDEDAELVQINIIPGDIVTYGDSVEDTNGHTANSSATALYTAIEACQELNPSPAADDDDEADMPSFPSTDGWITSDNANAYLDEDGQFKPPADWSTTSLGPGAGHPRAASEDGQGDTETKWQRTD